MIKCKGSRMGFQWSATTVCVEWVYGKDRLDDLSHFSLGLRALHEVLIFCWSKSTIMNFAKTYVHFKLSPNCVKYEALLQNNFCQRPFSKELLYL